MHSHADYSRLMTLAAPAERVFNAIATLDGVRQWWSTDVVGTSTVGDVLRFGFSLSTHGEWIVMRVDEAIKPSTVRWTCVAQYVAPAGISKHDEWIGTEVSFRILAVGPDTTELRFGHAGLNPALECYSVCENGWNHFLDSLVSFVEAGAGWPFGV